MNLMEKKSSNPIQKKLATKKKTSGLITNRNNYICVQLYLLYVKIVQFRIIHRVNLKSIQFYFYLSVAVTSNEQTNNFFYYMYYI